MYGHPLYAEEIMQDRHTSALQSDSRAGARPILARVLVAKLCALDSYVLRPPFAHL